MTDSTIQDMFAAHRASQRAAARSTTAQRIAKLERFKQVVLARADAVCDAIAADLGRPRTVALSAEVTATVTEIDLAIANLDGWMQPVAVVPTLPIPGLQASITYEARGKVLVLGPWNFPIGLVLQPVVAAVAAGNVVIAKPNEMAPHCSAVTAAILREAFDPGDVAVIEGGVDVAEALLELPFDHIFFTGSPKVGRTVMAAAARHLASVTLELGGKCPVIVDEGANLALVAKSVMGVRCLNNGQLCLAPDHVWVRASIKDAFLAALTDAAQAMFYKDGVFDAGRTGKIIDDRNFARVTGYISDAVARGATVHHGGGSDVTARTIEPTILTGVPLDAAVMQDEIFGPVLPVLSFDSLDDILAYQDTRGKPLALYVFSTDEAFTADVLACISSGGATVNGVLLHASEMGLPFGGVNESGIGRYHGIHGFRELSHERALVVSPSR